MTPEERLKSIEAKFRDRGLNPWDYLPVMVPQSFFSNKDDEDKMKIACFLEKVFDAVTEDGKDKKDGI